LIRSRESKDGPAGSRGPLSPDAEVVLFPRGARAGATFWLVYLTWTAPSLPQARTPRGPGKIPAPLAGPRRARHAPGCPPTRGHRTML